MGNNSPNFFVMFYGGLDLDLFCFCKSLGVQIKMSNCAKKCTHAVGWTGLLQGIQVGRGGITEGRESVKYHPNRWLCNL